MAIFLAEIAGEHAHLVEQVDGAKWRVDVSTDENNGQMAWQAFEEVATHVFLTWGDE